MVSKYTIQLLADSQIRTMTKLLEWDSESVNVPVVSSQDSK